MLGKIVAKGKEQKAENIKNFKDISSIEIRCVNDRKCVGGKGILKVPKIYLSFEDHNC